MPVAAMVMSKSFSTEEPWEPWNTLFPPQMLSAAMRPCLLAGPARAMRAGFPVTKWRTSTASPTA